MNGLTKNWDLSRFPLLSRASGARTATEVAACRQEFLMLKAVASAYTKQVGWQLLMSDVLQKMTDFAFDGRVYNVKPHVVSLPAHKIIFDFKFDFSSGPVQALSDWMHNFTEGYFPLKSKPSSGAVYDWDKTAQSLIGSGQKISLAYGVAYKHALAQGKGSAYFSNDDRQGIMRSLDLHIKKTARNLGKSEQEADALAGDAALNGTALSRVYLAESRAVLERHVAVMKRLNQETHTCEKIIDAREKHVRVGRGVFIRTFVCA